MGESVVGGYSGKEGRKERKGEDMEGWSEEVAVARKVREAGNDEMDGRRRGDHEIEDAADDVKRSSEEKRRGE